MSSRAIGFWFQSRGIFASHGTPEKFCLLDHTVFTRSLTCPWAFLSLETQLPKYLTQSPKYAKLVTLREGLSAFMEPPGKLISCTVSLAFNLRQPVRLSTCGRYLSISAHLASRKNMWSGIEHTKEDPFGCKPLKHSSMWWKATGESWAFAPRRWPEFLCYADAKLNMGQSRICAMMNQLDPIDALFGSAVWSESSPDNFIWNSVECLAWAVLNFSSKRKWLIRSEWMDFMFLHELSTCFIQIRTD